MIKVVSWNIAKRKKPWQELVKMGADVALVQETRNVPEDISGQVNAGGMWTWERKLCDSRSLVVQLSNRVKVEWFEPIRPNITPKSNQIGVSDIATIAAARVIPHDCPDKAFIAVSMYARWLMPHPSVKTNWSVGYADASAHRIISDLSAFIGDLDPSTHRILAVGDMNTYYGSIKHPYTMPARDQTVFCRMAAIGLEFLGPQVPNGRRVPNTKTVPPDTQNVVTYKDFQLDYAFASRGFHESVKVCAMNEVNNWGSSDHCRLLIKVDCG